MANIKANRVGIIMNGVTGRMGSNQHLMRSIVAIIRQGGVKVNDNEIIMPDPILVGRNPEKLKKISQESNIERWTTNLDEALSDDNYSVYFDAQTTSLRVEAVKKAIIDKENIIPSETEIGFNPKEDRKRFPVTPRGITVVPKGYFK